MFGFFNWIRQQARAALIAGIQDGVAELEAVEFSPGEPVRLTLKVAPALPAPAIEADPAPHEVNGAATRKTARGRA